MTRAASAGFHIVDGMDEANPLRYGMRITIDAPYADALAATRIALANEGFGVVNEMDVKAIMKQKLDVDSAPYMILGACNPPLAHRALTADPDIGLLLPCNVVVRAETGDRSIVETIDPLMMASVARQSDELRSVALEVRSRLQRILAALEEAAGDQGQLLHSSEYARPSAGR